ncbi:MAG TPA: helix-turn-helix domain-containing protein [Mycobacteriales bacterium]|nr:helix-turn-helix domain-containing protein [Mycobacteriales bacterium]
MEQTEIIRQPLTPEETAERLRVSKWTVYKAIKAGDIRVIKLGRCLRVPPAEIDRLLEGA